MVSLIWGSICIYIFSQIYIYIFLKDVQNVASSIRKNLHETAGTSLHLKKIPYKLICFQKLSKSVCIKGNMGHAYLG